ncbi:hypothetical protein, partial [Dyadobacter frigoris]
MMKMASEQHTQLWALSEDANQYERNRNLLSGDLKNSLSPEQINGQTLSAGLSHVRFKNVIELIHDGCDIRKPSSKALPNLS